MKPSFETMTSQALVKRSKSYYGELKDGKENGFGTMFHCNGAFYIGNWKEGEYHGKGLYKFVDGGSYDGEWCEGKAHGRGLHKYADGRSYDGEFREGHAHGRGLIKYADGSSYDGNFREGKRHGRGLFEYSDDGGSYDGEWRDDEKHGKGLYKHPSGASYDGNFLEGKRHGKGLQEYDDGDSYDGDWREDKMHGKGLFKASSGTSYDGEWYKGKRHGKGLHNYADGGTYNGEWLDDKRHGRGLYQHANGDLYDGEWCEDKQHGRGLEKCSNGDTYDGQWFEGNQHGRGVETYADGNSYNGDFCEGKRHGRGLYKYADGASYNGEWCEDRRHGRGLIKYGDGRSYDGEWCKDNYHGRGLHKNADGSSYNGKWIDGKPEGGNHLQIIIQDNCGLQRDLIVPADSKASAIFSAYEEMTGRSPCRLKHKGRYIFYSQSKKKSLKHFGICNNDFVAVEVPVLTDMSNNHMENPSTTSSTKKRKVAKAKRQPTRQRRPWAGSVIDTDSDRVKHSRQMNLVLKEIQPQLEQIRRHLNDLTLERTQPKDKTTALKHAPPNFKQVECRPISVGIGSKAGKGSFVVNVGEANNLYKTSKHSKLIRSKPSICLDLHKLTKEQALAALNDSLPTWIETANSGVYPFVIQVRIICGKGSQTLSEVVMKWINSQQQVAHAPKQKQ